MTTSDPFTMKADSLPAALSGMLDVPEEDIDLLGAVCLIAKVEYSELDTESVRKKIDDIASVIRDRIGVKSRFMEIIEEISSHLFSELGFEGNAEDYYDLGNSFLNVVLEKKKGIPITLSVIYMEVAKRLGLNLYGVGLPGHFIVKYSGKDEEIFIDPFNQGAMIDEEDCQKRLDSIYGGHIKLERDHLDQVTKKQIIARVLNNLKGIYLYNKELQKALLITEMMLAVSPGDPYEIRDRGLMKYNLRFFAGAQEDLEYYIRSNPRAEDVDLIARYLREIRTVLENYR